MAKKRGRSAAFMRSINPRLNSSSKKRGQTRMARRRSRHSFSRGSRRKSSSMMGSIKSLLFGGAIYGAARAPVANVVTPMVAKVGVIPAQYADEAGMGIVSYLLAKYGNGLVRDTGRAGLTIEAARVAETLTASTMQSATTSQSIF